MRKVKSPTVWRKAISTVSSQKKEKDHIRKTISPLSFVCECVHVCVRMCWLSEQLAICDRSKQISSNCVQFLFSWNLDRLTWVKHSTHSYLCVLYFYVSKQWYIYIYGWQCLGFLTCADWLKCQRSKAEEYTMKWITSLIVVDQKIGTHWNNQICCTETPKYYIYTQTLTCVDC